MRHPFLLGLCLVLISAPVDAQPGLPTNLPKSVEALPKGFTTEKEFERWTENYYRDPQPDMLDEAFRFFLDSDLAKDENRRVEFAAFFGGALARTPAMAQAVRDAALRDDSYPSLFALVNTLWLADNEECRTVMRALVDHEPNEEVKEFIKRRAQAQSPLADGAPVDSVSQMQLLWARFNATGDPHIPERISEVILTLFATSLEAQIFQEAVRDSLRAHGDKPEVREGLRRAIENAKPTPLREDAQQLLDTLTAAAQSPSPEPPKP